MNFKDKLKRITVRIQSKGILGSGALFKLSPEAEAVYLVTAKHNILGEKFDNGAN